MPTSWNSRWITANTITTTISFKSSPLVLKTDIWYMGKKKPKDINEFLKRVIIDKTIKLRYYYDYERIYNEETERESSLEII